jgi:ABC-type branched-subunit amino acid transport system ATPase component
VHGVTVRFGGVTAVHNLSLSAPAGQITGLIGPNGAGKTTTFNVCCGLQRPSSGRLRLDGYELTRLPAASRARSGIGRTFQQVQMFESMSVHDNLSLACEAFLAGGNPIRQLVPARTDRALIAERVAEAIELCDLTRIRSQPVSSLSTGHRRRVELARCVAVPYRTLLLDEPSSGLDSAESAAFAKVIRQIVARWGVGVLLVEHDMNLVMDLCEHIYVMDFGELIFDGSPAQVRQSGVVRDAYLGRNVARPACAEEANAR